MPSTATCRVARSGLFLGLVSSLSISLAGAAVPKQNEAFLDHKAFFRPELYISTPHAPLADVIDQLPNRAALGGLPARAARPTADLPRLHRPALGRGHQHHGRRPAHPRQRRRQPGDAGEPRRAPGPHRRGRRRRRGRGRGRWPSSGPTVTCWASTRAQLGAVRADAGHARPLAGQHPAGRAAACRCATAASRPASATATWSPSAPRPGATSRARRQPAHRPPSRRVEAGFAYAGRPHRRTTRSLREPRARDRARRAAEHQEGEAFAGPVGSGYGHRLVWTFVFQRPPERRALGGHGGRPQRRGARLPGHQPVRRASDHRRRLPVTSTEICPDAADAAAPCRPAGRCPSPTPASPRPTTSPTAPASSTTRAAPRPRP